MGEDKEAMNIKLDIIIPIYNEKENIVKTLDALSENVKTPFRIIFCYDFDEDNTLPVLYKYKDAFKKLFVKNEGIGPHSAIVTGFKASSAPAVIVYPADDSYNAKILDSMYDKFLEGFDVVSASRLMRGGKMEGAPLLKDTLVRLASFTMHHIARIPVHDVSNGLRLFSRRAIVQIELESNKGFTYSIEILVKSHRLGWKIGEVPAFWFERTRGKSRFHVLKWLFPYIRWYLYGFVTTFLRYSPTTVKLRKSK